MHLVAPQHDHVKWNIRFRNHDGKIRAIPGDEDKTMATRIGNRVEMLVNAKQNGDQPPKELQGWIDNMPTKLSDRLVELGLISANRIERGKPISEHIDKFQTFVAVRKSNKAKQAKHQAGRVRLICKALKVKTVADLNADAFREYLGGLELAVATKRAYIIVMKDFAKEMARIGAVKESPFKDIKAPGQYENPEYERQPLTVTQFKMLMNHMDTFDRYFGQKARWTASDRKLIYWTAVKTGYRQSELKQLRKGHLFLDDTPAVVSLKARHTKNKTDGEVPIPQDLAAALKKYIAHLEPNDKIFWFPTTSGSVVDMMRRDLKGAGIDWKLPTGEIIDFHSLRSTAITWWLDVDGLRPKRVQVLARLKTLALVYNYSRNLRMEDFSWLEHGPKLVSTRKRRKAS
jgi:integrase